MAQLAEEKKEDEYHVTASTMKAIVCTTYGDPKDALKLSDVPMPKPKANELLIEIHSAALNPIDYKIVKGWKSTFLRKKFPWVRSPHVS